MLSILVNTHFRFKVQKKENELSIPKQTYVLKSDYYKMSFWLFQDNTIKYSLIGENVRPEGVLEVMNILYSVFR